MGGHLREMPVVAMTDFAFDRTGCHGDFVAFNPI